MISCMTIIEKKKSNERVKTKFIPRNRRAIALKWLLLLAVLFISLESFLFNFQITPVHHHDDAHTVQVPVHVQDHGHHTEILKPMLNQSYINRSNHRAAHDTAKAAAFKRLISSPDGVIRGDPTTNSICQESLLQAHGWNSKQLIKNFRSGLLSPARKDTLVRFPKNLPHAFASRESLSAIMAPPGRQKLKIRTLIQSTGDHEMTWTQTGVDGRNKIKTLVFKSNHTVKPSVAYLPIVKSGSSSIRKYMEELARSKGTKATVNAIIDENTRQTSNGRYHLDSDCFFTFVRDPLHRLISAYFTVHTMLSIMSKEKKYSQMNIPYKFWNVRSEPERFRTFLRELIKNPNEFTYNHPFQHVISMSGQISNWFGSNLTFIGRQEQLAQHWLLLGKESDCQAISFVNSGGHGKQELPHVMSMKDHTKMIDPELRRILGIAKESDSAGNRTERIVLPQWKVLKEDQSLFNSIVEHYWQDYVCFGYNTSYPDLGLAYTGKLQMPYSSS